MVTTSALDSKSKWELIGFWSKITRGMNQWSQDAVATGGGITLRTVQRIEASEAISVANLRGLAKGLGEAPDYFERPEWFEVIKQTFDAMADASETIMLQDHPDRIFLDAELVTSGQQLGQLIEQSQGRLFSCAEGVSGDVQDVSAELFDFVLDLGDIWSDLTFSDRRRYAQSLGEILDNLKAAGGQAASALRPLTTHIRNRPDIAAWKTTALYLHVLPVGGPVGKLFVQRDVQYGF